MLKFIKSENNEILLVFIHGFLGSEQTWINADGKHFYSLLLKGNNIKFDVAEFIYGEQGFFSKTSYILQNINFKLKQPRQSAGFINTCACILTESINHQCNNYKNIIFICHSMGGLVAKCCILNFASKGEAQPCPLIITLGTPHRGTEIASAGSILLDDPAVNDMRPTSPFMIKLNTDWASHLDSALPKQVSICGVDDAVVTREGGCDHVSKKEVRYSVEHNHRTIHKINDDNDLVIRIINAQIEIILSNPGIQLWLGPYIALNETITEYKNSNQDRDTRHIDTDDELMNLWDLNEVAYGRLNYPFEKYISLCKKYSNGPFAFFIKNYIVGGIAIWPVKQTWIDKLRKGLIKEVEITDKDLSTRRQALNWYIAGIVIIPKHKHNIGIFLKKVCTEFICNLTPGQEIYIWALALSKEGENLLIHFGFTKNQDGSKLCDKLSLYKLSLNLQHALKILEKLP